MFCCISAKRIRGQRQIRFEFWVQIQLRKGNHTTAAGEHGVGGRMSRKKFHCSLGVEKSLLHRGQHQELSAPSALPLGGRRFSVSIWWGISHRTCRSICSARGLHIVRTASTICLRLCDLPLFHCVSFFRDPGFQLFLFSSLERIYLIPLINDMKFSTLHTYSKFIFSSAFPYDWFSQINFWSGTHAPTMPSCSRVWGFQLITEKWWHHCHSSLALCAMGHLLL